MQINKIKIHCWAVLNPFSWRKVSLGKSRYMRMYRMDSGKCWHAHKLAHCINILIMSMREVEVKWFGHSGRMQLKQKGSLGWLFGEEFSIVKRHLWFEFQMRFKPWDLFHLAFFFALGNFFVLFFTPACISAFGVHCSHNVCLSHCLFEWRKANFCGQLNHLPPCKFSEKLNSFVNYLYIERHLLDVFVRYASFFSTYFVHSAAIDGFTFTYQSKCHSTLTLFF